MNKTMEPLDAWRGFRNSTEAIEGLIEGRYDMIWFKEYAMDSSTQYVGTRSLKEPGKMQVTCFQRRACVPLGDFQCGSLMEVPAWLRRHECEVFCVHYQRVALA